MAGVGKKAMSADINIVPLVDVVLTLLIIFMVITPLLIKQMDVQVPEKSEVDIPDELPKDQLVLSMQEDHSIYLNKEQVPLEALPGKLERVFNARPKAERVIFFDAHDDINYADSVKVMDIIRGAGAQKIGIVEEHKDLDEAGEIIPDAPIEP